jgi:hypothetical protein
LKFQVKNKTEKKTIKEVGTKEGNAAAKLVRLLASETCHPDQSSISHGLPIDPKIHRHSQDHRLPVFWVCQDLYVVTLVQSVLAPRVQKRLKTKFLLARSPFSAQNASS